MIDLEHRDLRLRIDDALGAGIRGLWVHHAADRWAPLLREVPATSSNYKDLSCYVLAPWSNRIPHGRFRFEGREHQVPIDRPSEPSAIHGLSKTQAFTILDRSPVSARLECRGDDRWPWPMRYEIRYELLDDGVQMRVRMRNDGSAPCPAGGGFHPFFSSSPFMPGERPLITASVRARYPLERCLPIGDASADPLCGTLNAAAGSQGLEVGNVALDDCFLGSCHGATIEWPRSRVRVRFECSDALTHTVIYVPAATKEADKSGAMPPFFCVEPVSMVNGGFGQLDRDADAPTIREHGVRVLSPGETLELGCTLRLERA